MLPGARLLGLHVRLEVRNRALHRPRALDHLRQEHPARAEEVADDLHPVHQRPLDHVQRPLGARARLFRVLLDEVDDPVDERVLQPLAHGRLAPGEIELALGASALDGVREGNKAVCGVRPAVEQHVVDALEQVGRNVLVDDELARVHDAHVEPDLDRVVEERGVHRLADGVVATEREGEVRDPAARPRARAALLDQRQRLDERLCVAVVLLDSRRDREHVRVEDDVLREPAVTDEQVVGAAADLDLALDRVRLALLVERHHDDAGAVAADPPRLLEEQLLSLLEADRVDDSLPLHALEAGLEHGEARAVDDDRDPRDLGLGREQVEERRHRALAVEQVGVHVHVEEVRAAAHLLERDVDRALVVVRLDQPAEARRAGDVRALADHHEAGVRAELERLEAAEPRPARALGHGPGRKARDRGRDLARVVGRRAAAAADDVDEAGLGELAQQARRVVRLLVVAAEGIRQAGVRMAARERVREPRELRDVRPHLLGAERAVDADDQRVRVLDRVPERLERLAGERASGEVDDRDGDPQRQLRRDVLRGGDGRLRVQRVEDRLDEQEVDAAVPQGAHLLGVRLDHVVEGDRPVGRVVDLRRERERHVQRAQRARDEPAASLVRRLPREPGALDVHVVHGVLEPVVGLTDPGRRERVRRRDVGARLEVRAVDAEHDVRPRQVEQVGVAGDVARMVAEALAAVVLGREAGVLDHRPPGAVEHEDALCQQLSQSCLCAHMPSTVAERGRTRL